MFIVAHAQEFLLSFMAIKKISVVIPCFNEERRIKENITHIAGFLEENFEFFEIIAVNDGSTDKTLEKLTELQGANYLTVINNNKNSGKGHAVRDGILRSNCDVVMFLDADLAIPIEELPKFITEIEAGNDLVVASRFVPGVKIIKPVLWHRRVMEKIFRIMRMMILNNWSIKDTQCGFKVFRREAAMKIFSLLTVRRFAFDAEIIFVAKHIGCKIKELPITLQNPKNSHVRLIFDPINMFLDLLKIRINHALNRYS